MRVKGSGYSELVLKLDEFIRKYYTNQLIRGIIYSFTALIAFFLITTGIEYIGEMGRTGRGILFYGYILLAVAILIRFIFIPLFHLARIGKIISYDQAAEIIGKHFQEVKDKLINTLQLQQTANSKAEGQIDLIEASINQRIQELKPVQFSAAIDLGENVKFLKWALIPLLIFLGLWIFFPSILKDSSNRIVNYQVAFEPKAPFEFSIVNKELSTATQQDFELEIEINGSELPEESYISIGDARFKLNKVDKQHFTYSFKNVQRNVDFKLYADGFYSSEFTLKALPNPVLTNFRIILDYPAYTGMKDEIITNSGDLNIPAGTKATWEFSTQNTSSLNLSFSDTIFSVPEESRGTFKYNRRFTKDNNYKVSTSNEFIKEKEQVEYSIRVIPDSYPVIGVREQADSMFISRLYFKGETEDDYGFSSLKFVYQQKSENEVTISNALDVPFNKNELRSMFFWAYDFSSLNLKPGQELEYWFEVWDNDGIQGPKSSRTQKQFFRVPTLDEIATQRESDNKAIKSSLEETLEEAKELQDELKELNEKLLEKKEIGWQEKKKIQDLLKKQQELTSQIEQIKQENKENNSKNEEFRKSDENILEKQKQLEKLLEELLSDEMKKKLEELEKMLENMDKNAMKDKLDEMQMDNKDLEKELDRSLELFKQLEFEEKLNQTIDKLDSLAKKEDELSKKSEDKNQDADELKKEQDQLNKDFNKLRKDLDDLDKKNQDLESSQPMEDTDGLEEDIENDMQNSSDQLDQNKQGKASKSQKSASDKMKQMSGKMQAMQAQNAEETLEEDVKKLREILENLLQMSFDQERLKKTLVKTESNNPMYVTINAEQKRLSDDAKMIEDSLFALSKRIAEISSFVNKEISSIHMNMDKAISHMAERQTPSAAERQQFVMTSINNLALMLGELSEQMQQQLASQMQQKPGDGECKKPGSSKKPGKGKPSMATMKQLQQQINDQMKQMKDGMGKPGSSGKGGSEQLAKMAAQQEMLRNALQGIMNDMMKEGQSGSTGSIRNAINKMEQTETDIVNKNITSETLRRQEEIMTRLLEAEKAEREREQDNKRESNENNFNQKRNISVFNEYNRLMKEEAELLKTLPPELKPYYRNMVKEYFNTIN
ncbi:MAG: DUF4175 family protein [Bacteroidia bacterium]